jgi:hypothetical protein
MSNLFFTRNRCETSSSFYDELYGCGNRDATLKANFFDEAYTAGRRQQPDLLEETAPVNDDTTIDQLNEQEDKAEVDELNSSDDHAGCDHTRVCGPEASFLVHPTQVVTAAPGARSVATGSEPHDRTGSGLSF